MSGRGYRSKTTNLGGPFLPARSPLDGLDAENSGFGSCPMRTLRSGQRFLRAVEKLTKIQLARCGLVDVARGALIRDKWIVFGWSFSLYFPGWEKERNDEGIEVFGRAEGVHFEAGR